MSVRPKVVAALQARLASTRLPRKALAEVGGLPMLAFTAQRLASAPELDQVVVATTDDDSDDELERLLHPHGLPCHRGSYADIVARLLGAARQFEAQVLVRVWGDCPLVDPGLIGQVVRLLQEQGLDYADTGLLDGSRYPLGLDVEVYRAETLARINREADTPFFHEYPNEFLKAHRDQFRTGAVACDQAASHISVTVDYPADLELVRDIWQRLGQRGPVGWRELVALHEGQPELFGKASRLGRNLDLKAAKEQAAGTRQQAAAGRPSRGPGERR